MDYWDYIAHSQGSERAGHRYYARELVGNKGGQNVYRYFYTAEEYAAYKNNKGAPGRGTYAETGTSKSATIWPKGSALARRRAESRNRIEQEKVGADRKRTQTSIRAQKVHMDAERYRKQRSAEKTENRHALKKSLDRARRNTAKSKRIGEQHSMDMKRYASEARKKAAAARGEKHAQRVTEARAAQVKKDAMAYRSKRRKAQKVQMDAERYRKQRRAENTEKRNEWKRSVDRKRTQTSIRAQKVQMDAKNYRRKKRAAAKNRREFQKRVMDNTRTRKSYQPKMV